LALGLERRLLAFLSVAALGLCCRTTDDPATISPAPSEKPHSLSAEAPVDVSRAVERAEDVAQTRTISALGTAVERRLREASEGYAAPVKVIAAEDAALQALRSTDTIAGYPILGSRWRVGKEQGRRLAEVLLDDDSYSWNLRQRCREVRMTGLQFVHGTGRVDVVVGQRCRLAVFAFDMSGGVRRWGQTLTPAALSRMTALGFSTPHGSSARRETPTTR
jgi:hypothetical protein